MRHLLVAAALAAASASAIAADVDVSIRVGQPNFYGRLDIGAMPRPQVVYAQPVGTHPRLPDVVAAALLAAGDPPFTPAGTESLDRCP